MVEEEINQQKVEVPVPKKKKYDKGTLLMTKATSLKKTEKIYKNTIFYFEFYKLNFIN